MRRSQILSLVGLASCAALVCASALWCTRLYLAYHKASDLEKKLALIQVGVTTQQEANRVMDFAADGSRESEDCLGGPCLPGRVFEIRRSQSPLFDWWPEVHFRAGLFFDHGLVAIKQVEFMQAFSRYRSTASIIENQYPLSDRRLEHEIPNGYMRESQGTEVRISMDQRAPDDLRRISYDLNMACFLYLHGCPCPSRLWRNSSAQCTPVPQLKSETSLAGGPGLIAAK